MEYMNKKYTIEHIIKTLQDLSKDLGREPTWQEIQGHKDLPTTRTLQRSYGGLQGLRKLAGFKHIDHTRGALRKNELNRFLSHSLDAEKKLIDVLRDKHGFESVHEQFPFGDNRRYRADCAVFNKKVKHVDIYDIFNPKDKYSLGGCLRVKYKKYKNIQLDQVFLSDWTYTVYFVCANNKVPLPEQKDDIELIYLSAIISA
jgi:hypothetical protein